MIRRNEKFFWGKIRFESISFSWCRFASINPVKIPALDLCVLHRMTEMTKTLRRSFYENTIQFKNVAHSELSRQ